MSDETYRDPQYCCLDCGSEVFRYREGRLYDECVSCATTRDVKRGPWSDGVTA